MRYATSHRFRLRIRRALVVLSLVGACLAVGASPGHAGHNYCHNEAAPGDVGVDVGPGILWVGVDTGINPTGSFSACVDDETYAVTVVTTGGLTVAARYCTGIGTCTELLERTGLVGTLTPSTSTGTLPVCVPTCTGVPFTPVKVDTGYDLYVDGTKVANVCVSIGTTC